MCTYKSFTFAQDSSKYLKFFLFKAFVMIKILNEQSIYLKSEYYKMFIILNIWNILDWSSWAPPHEQLKVPPYSL